MNVWMSSSRSDLLIRPSGAVSRCPWFKSKYLSSIILRHGSSVAIVVRLIHCYQRGSACNRHIRIGGNFCVGVFAQTSILAWRLCRWRYSFQQLHIFRVMEWWFRWLSFALRSPFEGGIIASHSSLSGTTIERNETQIMFYGFFFGQSISRFCQKLIRWRKACNAKPCSHKQ